jgi:RES domain-containing protein
MRIWSISNCADLSGIGGALAPGRWHSKGRPILYAAEHPALALLEVLVHFDRSELPDRYQLLGIDVTDDTPWTALTQSALPANWTQDELATRSIGDRWLSEGESLLLRAPSALVPHAWNVLVNPAHSDMASVTIGSIDRAPFGVRLG